MQWALSASLASLVAHDASKYPRFIEVARLYLGLDQVNDATRVLGSITEQLLAGRAENDLLELVQEVLARNPEHVEALRLLVRIHWWQRDMDNLRLALERLAESAEAAGLDQDERYALTQLVRLAPDEQRYAERLEALGGAAEEAVEEVAFALEPSGGDVPSFETFGAVPDEASTVETEATLQRISLSGIQCRRRQRRILVPLSQTSTRKRQLVTELSPPWKDLNRVVSHSMRTCEVCCRQKKP